jgi:hypothetical protein
MDFDARLDLTAAVRDRDALRRRFERASGSPTEIDAYVEMHAAEVRVTALDRYLAWSEDAPIGTEPRPSEEELEPYGVEVAWFDAELVGSGYRLER